MNKLIDILDKDKINIIINGRVCHHRIKILYALAKYYNINNYIEIGVHNGSSMSYVLQSPSIKNCVGIDPFELLKTNDPKMKHYQDIDKIMEKKTYKNIILNNKYNANIKLIKEYSNKVNFDNLEIDSYDLLFIDGDHCFNSVQEDYNKYKKIVRKGGFIVFDDLHQDGPNKVFNWILSNDKDVELFGIYDKTEGILRVL